jgi:hypothetical protein
MIRSKKANACRNSLDTYNTNPYSNGPHKKQYSPKPGPIERIDVPG